MVLSALGDLLEDTQHAEHKCPDPDCPVLMAQAVYTKFSIPAPAAEQGACQHRSRVLTGSEGLEGNWSEWIDGGPAVRESHRQYEFRGKPAAPAGKGEGK